MESRHFVGLCRIGLGYLYTTCINVATRIRIDVILLRGCNGLTIVQQLDFARKSVNLINIIVPCIITGDCVNGEAVCRDDVVCEPINLAKGIGNCFLL